MTESLFSVKKMKRILLCLHISVLSVLLAACQSGSGQTKTSESVDWAIYWYLCGSDLESKHASASKDMDEMLEVNLPENVKVVIETGGAAEWQNSKVKPENLTRFVYDHNGLKKVDTKELANMGAQETLSDFLSYCYEYHPAERSMVVLWNHG